jgi:hypothetical protein
MSSGGNSIGDFFVNLFFKVDGKSKAEVDKIADDLKAKFIELGKSALAFNEIREAVHSLLSPLHRMVEGVSQIAEHGDGLNNFAQVIGVTTQQLEKMQFVAHLADVEMGTMNFALSMLSRQMGEISSGGGKEVEKAFHKLGLSAKDSQGHLRNVGEMMPELIEKFSKMKDANERLSVAQDIFGRGARQLMPLLTKQAEEVAEMNKQFEALGGAYSKELIENSAKFSDNIKVANFSFNNMKRDLATGIIPEVTKFFDIWINWAKLHWPDISKTLLSLGHTVGDVFMKTAGSAFDSFLKYVAEVYKDKEKLAELGTVVKTLGIAFAVLFAILNPGKTIVTLLLAAIEDLMGAMVGKDSIVGRVSLRWREWNKELSTAFGWFEKIDKALEKMMAPLLFMERKLGGKGDLQGVTKGALSQAGDVIGNNFPVLGAIKQVGSAFADMTGLSETFTGLADQQRDIEKQNFLKQYQDPIQRRTAQQVMTSHPDMAMKDLKAMARGIAGDPTFSMFGGGGGKKVVNNVTHVHNYDVKAGPEARAIADQISTQVSRVLGGAVGGAVEDLATEGVD